MYEWLRLTSARRASSELENFTVACPTCGPSLTPPDVIEYLGEGMAWIGVSGLAAYGLGVRASARAEDEQQRRPRMHAYAYASRGGTQRRGDTRGVERGGATREVAGKVQERCVLGSHVVGVGCFDYTPSARRRRRGVP